MSWYLVPSLVALRDQANALWPNRDKASDGSIGDAAHRARKSDHNPDWKGAVHAYDLDEDIDGTDEVGGTELMFFAEHLRTTRDPRIKYVIYEGRMFASYETSHRPAWEWGPYSGTSNPHTRHMHISVLSTDVGENDTSPWFPQPEAPAPRPTPSTPGVCEVKVRVLKRGDKGGDVKSLQTLLVAKAGQRIVVDGDFGFMTEGAVKNVQRFFRLKVDGVAGAKTWPTLFI